ncbi:MAG: hypothetical protein JST39_19100 [Bacteroidetes bacterium]|nr:hypothetical protein [Bacteroidota bacterium]
MGMAILLGSCAGSRVQTLTKSTQEALELIKKEAQRAIQLTAEKVRNNEVDPDIGNNLVANLQVAEKKVSDQIAQAAELDKSGSRDAQLKFAEKSNVIIQSALTDLRSLNDLYDVTTFSQFETATFFPSGGYTIPAENMEEAKNSIEPIAKRIIRFIGDHPKQHFVAVIVCYGYSDETPLGKDSYLYDNIMARIKTPNPTRQEMNTKLSELRAKTIATLLVDVIKANEGMIPNPNLINYDIKFLGRGETLPYPNKIKDYQASDRRRRLVSLIWNVLPGSLYMKSVEDNASAGVSK